MPLTPQSPQSKSLLDFLESSNPAGVRVDPFKVNALFDTNLQAPPQPETNAPEDADGFLSTLWQIPLGFAEGFTTISFGDKPVSTNEAIARKVGNLLGFVGYIPSPVNLFRAGALRFLTRFAGGKIAKRAAEKIVVKAGVREAEKLTGEALLAEATRIANTPKFTNAINIRSVPMWATDAMMTSPVGRGVAEASRKLISQSKYIKTSNRFLNPGMIESIGHGAVHLGLASTISAAGINPLEWKERIDDALPAMFSGMVFGAGFAGIGNLGLLLGRSMSGGNPDFAKRALQGVAGAVFQGLPATMQNVSTPEQVYEYLLGAWFGFHSQPWTAQAAGAKVKYIRNRFEGQPERELNSILRDVKNPGQFEKDMGLDLIRKQGPQYNDLADQITAQYFNTLPGMRAADAQKLFREYRIARDQNLGGVYFTTPEGTQYLSANEGLTIAERKLVEDRITELVDQAMASGEVKSSPDKVIFGEMKSGGESFGRIMAELSSDSSVTIPTSVLSDRGMLYRYFQNKIAITDVYRTIGGKRGAMANDTGFVEALALKRTLDEYGAIDRWQGVKGKFQMSASALQELSRYKTREYEVRVFGDKRSELAGLHDLQPGDTIYHREFGALTYVKTVGEGKRRGQIIGKDKFGRLHRVGKTKTGEMLSFAPWQETKLADRPEFVTGFLRKWFTSAGDLPEAAYDAKIRRDQSIEKNYNRTKVVLNEFDKAVREEWGVSSENLSKDQIDLVNMVLTGQGTPDALPAKIAGVAQYMRGQVDRLSRELVRKGVVQGELAAVLAKNEGMYLHRQYRVFNEPGFAEKRLEQIRSGDAEATAIYNRVVTLLKSEHPDWTEADAGQYIQTVLLGGKEASDFVRRSTLGAKDLSMFIPRKDIAPEIRALWGEYTSPVQSYALSVMKMAGIVANHNMQKQIVDAGRNKFLFEPTEFGGTVAPDPFTGKRNVRFSEKIAEKGDAAMNILSGYYTTPEIKTAFKEALDPAKMGPLMQYYMRINGGVKMGKTVGSVMTHIRNLSSFGGFTLANGNFFHPDSAKESFRAIMGDLKKTVTEGKDFKLGNKNYTLRGFIERMIELEVMSSGANAGEWRGIMQDSGFGNLQEFLNVGARKKFRKFFLDVPQAIYGAEDDLIKVYNFLAEFKKYESANTGMSQKQLEEYAAKIVTESNPTYSRVNKALQTVRRAPFVGSFVAFPAEIMRTGKNIIAQIGTEIASDNPAVQKIGYQRLSGALMAALIPTAAALTTRWLMGIDRKDDEDFRRYLPPWAANSELLYLGKNDAGSYRYVQFSYTDPYSYLKEPLMALMRGTRNEDVVQGLYDGISQALEPFLGEEILSRAILDVVRNRKADNGGQVYNEAADADTRAQQIGEYMLRTIQPGTVASMQRIASGITGETNLYGRDYDATTEALAAFSGVRIENMDIAQGLSFKARNFSRDMSQASRILSQVAGSRGSVTEADVEKAYVEMERTRQRIWLEFYRDVRAARRMGVDDDHIRTILRAASVPQQMQDDLINGVYRYRKVGTSFLQQVEKLATIKGREADVKSRRELVQALEEKYSAQRLGVLPSSVLVK